MPDRSTFGDLSMSRWHGRTVTTGARPLRPGDMLPPPNPEENALPCPDHSSNQPRR